MKKSKRRKGGPVPAARTPPVVAKPLSFAVPKKLWLWLGASGLFSPIPFAAKVLAFEPKAKPFLLAWYAGMALLGIGVVAAN